MSERLSRIWRAIGLSPYSHTDIDLIPPVFDDVWEKQQKSYYIGNPIHIFVRIKKRKFKVLADSESSSSKRQISSFKRRIIYGDFRNRSSVPIDNPNVVTVKIIMQRGETQNRYFLLKDIVEVPPFLPESSKRSRNEDRSSEIEEVDQVGIEADFLHIVVDCRDGNIDEISGLNVEQCGLSYKYTQY